MERRLILLRHAKSAWDTDAASDHDRPLNKRGRRDAPRIGARIAELGWAPEWVLSSDAARTRETWRRLSEAFASEAQLSFTARLYHAGLSTLRAEAAAVPAEITTLMAIGHNPGWEQAAATLCGQPDLTMTTCNAALLSASADSWPEALARDGGWELHELLRPKTL